MFGALYPCRFYSLLPSPFFLKSSLSLTFHCDPLVELTSAKSANCQVQTDGGASRSGLASQKRQKGKKAELKLRRLDPLSFRPANSLRALIPETRDRREARNHKSASSSQRKSHRKHCRCQQAAHAKEVCFALHSNQWQLGTMCPFVHLDESSSWARN